jgi:hypothetical protein
VNAEVVESCSTGHPFLLPHLDFVTYPVYIGLDRRCNH